MTLSRDASAVLRGAEVDRLPVATLVGQRPPPRIDPSVDALTAEIVDDHASSHDTTNPTTDQCLSEAYEAGFSEGVGAAESAIRDTLASALAGLERAAGQLEVARKAWEDVGPDEAISLALELTEMILLREVASSDAPARDAIRRCFAQLEPGERATIRLSPSDFDALGVVDDLQLERTFELVSDPSIEPGDAVADLNSGSVDARIRTALDRVRQELQS